MGENYPTLVAGHMQSEQPARIRLGVLKGYLTPLQVHTNIDT